MQENIQSEIALMKRLVNDASPPEWSIISNGKTWQDGDQWGVKATDQIIVQLGISKANAWFIAQARATVPRLLKHIEDLESLVKKIATEGGDA